MQVFGAKKRCEGLLQVGFKLSASISSDCRWGAETGDPCLCEGSSYSVCGAVSDWDSLWPTREAIHAGEKVHRAVRGRERTNEVNVDLVKMSIGCGKSG